MNFLRVAVLTFVATMVFASTTGHTTTYISVGHKLTVLDPGKRAENGVPDKFAFPRTIHATTDGQCAAGEPFWTIAKKAQKAVLLLDFDLDGNLIKVELISPLSDDYWSAVLDMFNKCNSLERAFTARGISGWSNIKVELE